VKRLERRLTHPTRSQYPTILPRIEQGLSGFSLHPTPKQDKLKGRISARYSSFPLSSPTQLKNMSENPYYRSYVWGLVGLITGGLGLITCYCAPTSLGVLIFGLIVYLNPTAKYIFSLGKNGLNQREIEETLRQGPPRNQNSYLPSDNL